LLEGEQLTISTTGGKGSVTVSPNGGSSVTTVFGGNAEVKVVGPIDDGAKVGITAVGADIDYHTGGGSLVTLNDAGTSLVDGAGIALDVGRDVWPSDGYWTHIHANRSNVGSLSAPDISGGLNPATAGANLSAAQLSANANYYSTVLPDTGVTDSVLRFPPLYHQWLQGENLFLFWSGIVTPGGATQAIIGNTADVSIAGFRVRCYSTGRMDVVVHDGVGGTQFASQTTDDAAGKPFVAGELHSIAVFWNGSTGKLQQYVDGLLNKENILVRKDETGGYTFNIGSCRPAPGLAEGLATQTRALVILRGRYGQSSEHLAPLLAQRLHESPEKLVTNLEW
jgi:hypothetical protein